MLLLYEVVDQEGSGNAAIEQCACRQDDMSSKRTPPKQWKLIFNEYDDSKELYNLENDPHEIENLIDKNLEIEELLWNKLQKIISNY